MPVRSVPPDRSWLAVCPIAGAYGLPASALLVSAPRAKFSFAVGVVFPSWLPIWPVSVFNGPMVGPYGSVFVLVVVVCFVEPPTLKFLVHDDRLHLEVRQL